MVAGGAAYLPRGLRAHATTPDVAGMDAQLFAPLPLAGRFGGAQLVGHGGHHHPGSEEQSSLEPERRLVVQQLLPPAPDDVLRDVDSNDTARVRLPDLHGVVDNRLGDL